MTTRTSLFGPALDTRIACGRALGRPHAIQTTHSRLCKPKDGSGGFPGETRQLSLLLERRAAAEKALTASPTGGSSPGLPARAGIDLDGVFPTAAVTSRQTSTPQGSLRLTFPGLLAAAATAWTCRTISRGGEKIHSRYLVLHHPPRDHRRAAERASLFLLILPFTISRRDRPCGTTHRTITDPRGGEQHRTQVPPAIRTLHAQCRHLLAEQVLDGHLHDRTLAQRSG